MQNISKSLDFIGQNCFRSFLDELKSICCAKRLTFITCGGIRRPPQASAYTNLFKITKLKFTTFPRHKFYNELAVRLFIYS